MNNPLPNNSLKTFAMLQAMALTSLGENAFSLDNKLNPNPHAIKIDKKPIKKAKRKKKGNYFNYS
jgi:hypothetical protein